MDTKTRVLTALALTAVYLLLAQALLAAGFPGRARLDVTRPPAAGQFGELTYTFKAREAVPALSVTFQLPAGLGTAGDPLTRQVGPVAIDEVVRVTCRFKAEGMGIFRPGAVVVPMGTAWSYGPRTWYAFFEAGVDQGYSPVVRPRNEWNQEAKSAEPTADEFEKIATSVVVGDVLRSRTRIKTLDRTLEADRIPSLSEEGDVQASVRLSDPPLLGQHTTLTYEVEVREDLGRSNAPVEVILLFPPNAFRVHEVRWPAGGEETYLERGVYWRGVLPKDRRLVVSADVSAQAPGEGKIRALVKVQGRRGTCTRETPLYLEVNRHSARVMEQEPLPEGFGRG